MVDGASHSVPEGITVIQAMFQLGRSMTKNVGCLGGACGACPISIRLSNRFDNQTALACQTLVSEGMSVTFLPSDASKKEIAALPAEEEVGSALLKYYPETRRCVACRSCSMVCPQGIDAMAGVRSAINGDLEAAANTFSSCVMCGLCASVCGAGVRPHRMGIYARRLVGAFPGEKATHLLTRINEIESGRYQEEWEGVMQACHSKIQGEIVQRKIMNEYS